LEELDLDGDPDAFIPAPGHWQLVKEIIQKGVLPKLQSIGLENVEDEDIAYLFNDCLKAKACPNSSDPV